MDDSYGDGNNLYNFYIQLFKIIIRSGAEKAHKELAKSLPVISKLGSKDDMSVACVYDDTNLTQIFFLLTKFQKDALGSELNNVKEKIISLQKKIEDAGNPETLDNKERINYEYALKDLAKAKDKVSRLKRKRRAVKGEETKYRNRLKEIDPMVPPVEEDSSMELIANGQEPQ